jgi:[acyl-carrier-protein] S-malonyltransferase
VAEELGCRGIALPVAGAFHSALMEPAAQGLRPVLNEASFTEPAIPVIANVDASYHSDATAIRESLYQQMTRPVLWQKCIERMMADGIERFVEVGPGRVLTGLMRKIGRKIPAVSVNSVDSIASVLAAGAVS